MCVLFVCVFAKQKYETHSNSDLAVALDVESLHNILWGAWDLMAIGALGQNPRPDRKGATHATTQSTPTFCLSAISTAAGSREDKAAPLPSLSVNGGRGAAG